MTDYDHDPNTLAESLDAILPPGQFDAPMRNDDALVDAAVLLAAPPQPAPLSDETRLAIRSQILAAYRQQQQPRVTRFPLLPLVRWGVAASLVLVLLLGGVQPAVLASIPGDILYPVKQVVEQIETKLATSPQNLAFVHLTHAERRTEETLVLLERGQFAADLVTEALDDLVAAAGALRDETDVSPTTRFQLEARTVQVNALLDSALTLAVQLEDVSQESIDALAEQLRATPAAVDVPPSAAVTAVPTPEPTSEPDSAAVTDIPDTPAPESTEEIAELPTNIVIEGPIEAIDGNIITIFGLHIQIDPDHPIFARIQVGDDVRVEGSMAETDGIIVIAAVDIMIIEVEIVIPDSPAGAPPVPGLPSNCKQTSKGKIKCKRS